MLNSKVYDKEKVYREILSRLNYDELFYYISNNKALQLKCKVAKLNKKYCTKNIIIDGIMALYEKMPKVEKFILNAWSRNVSLELKRVSKMKDKQEIDEYYLNKCEEDAFTFATVLWMQGDKELNELGDEYYKEYMKADYELFQEEYDMQSDDGVIQGENLLDMKLSDCIVLINKYKTKYEELKSQMDTKDIKYENLQKKMDELIKQGKDKNKELNFMNQKITKLENQIKDKMKINENYIKKTIDPMNELVAKILDQNEELVKVVRNVSSENAKVSKNLSEAQQLVRKKFEEVNNNLQEKIEHISIKGIETKIEVKEETKSFNDILKSSVCNMHKGEVENNRTMEVSPDVQDLLSEVVEAFTNK